MQNFWNRLVTFLDSTDKGQNAFTQSVIIVIIIYFLRYLVLFIVHRHSDDPHSRYAWKKYSSYLAFMLATILVGSVWSEGINSISNFLGLISAGLVIVLKDLIVNLASWFFIIWRRPFEVGDRIQIGDIRGDVIDMRLFQFTMMEIGNWVDADQSTGRVLHIANGRIWTDVIANYSKGFSYIWCELPVLLTFESNWQKSKGEFLKFAEKHSGHLAVEARDHLKKASQKYFVFYSKLTPIVYTSVRDSGILLTVRFLCNPRQRRNMEQNIWEDILLYVAENPDVDFAYPTQRFYTMGEKTPKLPENVIEESPSE